MTASPTASTTTTTLTTAHPVTARTRRLARDLRIDLAGLDPRQARRAVRRAGQQRSVTVVLEFDVTELVAAFSAFARASERIRNRWWCIGCKTTGQQHELFGDVCRAIAGDRDAKAREDAS